MAGAKIIAVHAEAGPEPGEEFCEVLTLGRGLAGASENTLSAAVLGELSGTVASTVSSYGVDQLDHIDGDGLDTASIDQRVEALTQWADKAGPKVVLFSQSFDVRLLAPRLAMRLGASVVMNALAVENTDDGLLVTTAAFGGDTRAVYQMRGQGPWVVCFNANAALPETVRERSEASVKKVTVDLSATDERVRVLDKASAEGPRLEHAQTIVAGGRGLGDPDNFRLVEELAEALGGMAGASRPIVDDGWTDSSHQVGLTGKITRPGLYIAAGISGASQHMVGCSAAKTLVAINKDPAAAIFRYARYGIVGDCVEILPELTKAVSS